MAKREGKVLGIPYDLRKPTGERAKRRYWNTASGNPLAPKVYGVGWTVNVGSLVYWARRLAGRRTGA